MSAGTFRRQKFYDYEVAWDIHNSSDFAVLYHPGNLDGESFKPTKLEPDAFLAAIRKANRLASEDAQQKINQSNQDREEYLAEKKSVQEAAAQQAKLAESEPESAGQSAETARIPG